MDFPYVEFHGHRRFLSCIPSDPRAMAASPFYAETIEKKDIIEWLKEHNGHYDLGTIYSPILDQESVGACASFSATSVFNLTWNIMNQSAHEFSPWFQYAQVNRGQDQGSSPIDNMGSLKATGICLDFDNPNHVYFKKEIPKICYTSANRFRADQVYLIRDEDDLFTAPMLNRPVGFGMALPRKFENIDANTGIPTKGGFSGLHGMMIRGVYLHPLLNDLIYIVQNSWTKQFGIQDATKFGWPHADDLQGCCFIPPDMIFESSYFEGYCIETAMIDTSEQIETA